MSENKLCFEDALKRLNEVVRHLEDGDLPLEDSLTLFEEGAGLVRICNELLDSAEQRVKILKNDFDSEPVEVEYDTEN
ncbi:MAG: exodeoxyribonuclease VII small subunit [Eubacteriales bacterium]|nr:exodeoxyribonuclease VII small subunit [Eubacteriales bacterium]